MAAWVIPVAQYVLGELSNDSVSKEQTVRPTIDWSSLVSSYDDGLDLTDEEKRARRENIWQGYF